jgi:hypothetical protein
MTFGGRFTKKDRRRAIKKQRLAVKADKTL